MAHSSESAERKSNEHDVQLCHHRAGVPPVAAPKHLGPAQFRQSVVNCRESLKPPFSNRRPRTRMDANHQIVADDAVSSEQFRGVSSVLGGNPKAFIVAKHGDTDMLKKMKAPLNHMRMFKIRLHNIGQQEITANIPITDAASRASKP